MGLLLSILFSYVGAMELIFIVRDIVHQVGLHHEQMKLNQSPSKTTSASSSSFSLLDLQQNLRKSIKSAHERLHETDTIQSMADGVQYEQGYRVPNDGEQNTLNRWMEARASVTIEPSHNSNFNSFENNCAVKTWTAATNTQNDDTFVEDDSLRSSNLSVETVIEYRKNDDRSSQIDSDDLRKNGSDDDVHPNIHFDEYSQDYLHALDGIAKKGQRKNEESRRRKSYKMFTGGHSGGDILLRRRSEDIDGETDNPWGELKPESFHNGLWKRERAISIAENEEMMAFVDDKSCHECPLNSISSAENKNGKTSGFHGERESDVSSENQFISSDNSEGIIRPGGNTIDTIRKLPEIFINGSDMAVEDGQMSEFIDYIENFDNDDAPVTSKFQLKEYLEQPESLRYTSFIYADKNDEDELEDISIVESVEYEPKDLANENKSSNFSSKRAINNRKPNMFGLATPEHLNYDKNNSQYMYRPVIRITPTEDERIEQFLHDENCEKINAAEDHFITEVLIKSKTTQMFYCNDENTSDVESFESESRVNSPTLNTMRRESLLSDGDSDPIQFECKQSTDPNRFYNREDSSASNKSNVLFERSQSRFSELEYIKGRDDWKDSYLRYDISEEIDADTYHHHRRHSETVDTLEYIRGREDWLQNELHHAGRNSLPRIFEMIEPKIVIQDEIDSDEYHHNFFQNETFYLFNGKTRQEKKTFKNSIQSNNFCEIENVNGSNNSDCKVPEWTDNVEIVSSIDGSMVSSANGIPNESNEINEAIKDLITHKTPSREDIEITVLDLASDMVSDQQQKMYNPVIVIDEATEGNQETPIELNLKQMLDTASPEPADIPASFENTDTNNTLSAESIRTENNNDDNHRNTNLLSNEINQFLTSEIMSEMKSRRDDEKGMNLLEMFEVTEVTQQNNRSVRATSEKLDSMSQSLLKSNEQKPRRTSSFENVEDLIRDVSNGPWFHK